MLVLVLESGDAEWWSGGVVEWWSDGVMSGGFVLKGSVRLCREAATQKSPGLKPWVIRSANSALKVTAEALLRLFVCYSTNIGCHFQGTFYYPPDPRLNPGLFCIAASRQSSALPYGAKPPTKSDRRL